MTPAAQKITAEHRARRALIYVRQSTPSQLEHHPESTARQYALRQCAYDLGWPTDAVEVAAAGALARPPDSAGSKITSP